MDGERREPTGPRAVALPLLHPIPLSAVGILVLNDHVLKAAAPGWVTGKVSDVAGLVFFPLLLHAAWALVTRSEAVGRRSLIVAVLLTGSTFAAVKVSPAAAEAYRVALGMLQWSLAAAGASIAGVQTPDVTRVFLARDPSDLIALPALVVPLLIALGRPTSLARRLPVTHRRTAASRTARPWRHREVALLVVAALASLATSKGTPAASAEYEETILLTAERPAAVRHLSFEVDATRTKATDVHLVADVWTTSGGDAMHRVRANDVRLSVLPDQPARGIKTGSDHLADQAFDLTGLCSQRCRHGATAIVRLTGDAPAAGREVVLTARLVASGDLPDSADDASAFDADVSLTNDVERGFVGKPPTVVARTDRTIRVGSDDPHASDEVTLRVAPEVLRAPLGFPLVGRLTFSLDTTHASDHPNAHMTVVSVGTRKYHVFEEEQPVDVDWLSVCTPADRCDIRISITSDYDATLNSDDFDPNDRTPGFVELRLSLEARLEAFDGRPLPADALIFVPN